MMYNYPVPPDNYQEYKVKASLFQKAQSFYAS